MALKSNFLSLDKPKIRLWLGGESDASSGPQALGTHFLPLEQPKMRLWLSQESCNENRGFVSSHFHHCSD